MHQQRVILNMVALLWAKILASTDHTTNWVVKSNRCPITIFRLDANRHFLSLEAFLDHLTHVTSLTSYD